MKKFLTKTKETLNCVFNKTRSFFVGVLKALKGFLEKLDRKRIRKILIIFASVFVSLCILVGVYALIINAVVVNGTKAQIITTQKAKEIDNFDCIIVLGCKVKDNGNPSDMLRDRLDRGIELYKEGVAPKILMSGDHGRVTYNEVKTMKEYAISKGVPSSDIFMDHAGFSTYETIYRAKDVFKVKKAVIVTQEYHLYRALYIANALDIETFGVTSDYHIYRGQTMRDIREILARNKDFITSIYKPLPTFLGEEISIEANGDITNDY